MKRLFPAWCYECNIYLTTGNSSTSAYLCKTCFANLPEFQSSICLKCGKSHNPTHCTTEWATAITDFYAIYPYHDPISKWISRLKYSRNWTAGRLLQGLVKNWFEEHRQELMDVDCLVPVPLHVSKLFDRGFNQSTYLLNKQRLLKCSGKTVRKMKRTSQQAGRSKKERQANLRGVFKVSSEAENKKLLLFDDVCTTGETLGEISRCLKSAGAKQVDALVLSRNI